MVGRSFYIASAILSFGIPAYAGIYVDPNSCPASVSDHVNDARQMAKTASDALKAKSPKDASADKGLFTLLFDEADRGAVQGFYDKVASLDSSSDQIRIYCNEDTITWPAGKDKNTDTTTYFVSKDWDDKQGGRTQEQDIGIENPARLPRTTVCEAGMDGYIINGFEERAGESHVIICSKMLINDYKKDRRRIPDIQSAGLDKRWYSLDLIDPMSNVLLHEFMHLNAVSGPLLSDYRTTISDIDECYGVEDCYKRKKSDPRGAIKNADSFAILGMGLSLQFESKRPKFTWVAGAVNIQNGQTEYAPYVKPRANPKRALDGVHMPVQLPVERSLVRTASSKKIPHGPAIPQVPAVPQVRGKTRRNNAKAASMHAKQSRRNRIMRF